MTTIINYLTYDFSKYNDVFQILDYKQLLPLSQLVDYDMLFNEYDSNIGTPLDLINYLNKIDPSILTDICSFLNSIPNNIQIKQSSAINWQCPGAVTVINGKQKNIKLLGEINQINNKVKVLFLIARAYCHQNYCGQLIFNQYDLWDKYWGPSSHSLFPEQVDCKIDITFEHDTITIKDNNTYTYGYEHDYLIKIVRTDIKHKYFKSTSYIILKNKENIKLTSLINGIYEISIAVSYTNGINGINDYVWSEFCTSTVQPQIELTIPEHYLIIDNEVYWEYHFVLPADSNGNEGLPKYFDKYQGKMRNYFLTWWKETADGKLDNGSDTLGGASLENCSYDLRYTTEKPKKDSIWIYYNNIPFENENKKKSNYINPLFPSDDPPFRDPSVNPYQKITVLGYQNIWVQMRVRNQIGAPDWPITDGYPTGLPLNIYNAFGDELYGYPVEINTPPYFKNVLATGDSNCEYPYTVGTFSWGAPADTMSPVQPLAAVNVPSQINFVFTPPVTWWATNSNDNTSYYQNNFKPDVKPLFMIFPLITYKSSKKETKYSDEIISGSNTYFRPYFIFTNNDYQENTDLIPLYDDYTNNFRPKECLSNILPIKTGYNFVDGQHYNTSGGGGCGLDDRTSGYYIISSNVLHTILSDIVINTTKNNLIYKFINNNGYISMDFSIFLGSTAYPESPIYIGIKVINYKDLRITNHRYPYDNDVTAIKIPPFNVPQTGNNFPQHPMNIDVQYSEPIPLIMIPEIYKSNKFNSSYHFNNYSSNDSNSTLTVNSSDVNTYDFYIKHKGLYHPLNKLTLTSLDNNRYYHIFITDDGVKKKLITLFTHDEKEKYQSYIIPRYYFDIQSFRSVLHDANNKNILSGIPSLTNIYINTDSILHLELINIFYGLDVIFQDYINIHIRENSSIKVKYKIYNPALSGYATCSDKNSFITSMHNISASSADSSNKSFSIKSTTPLIVPGVDNPDKLIDQLTDFAIKVEISYFNLGLLNININNYDFVPIYLQRIGNVYQPPVITPIPPHGSCAW